MWEKAKELVKKPVFWIALAGVGLFIYIRSKAASAQPSPAAGPAPMFGGGGGGGTDTGVSGGTSIQDQLAQQDLAAEQQRLSQEGALFNFDLQQKQRMSDILAPLQTAWANLQEAGLQNITDIATTGKLKSGKGVIPTSCQHGNVVLDPSTGLPTCRVPEGGGFKPFQQIGKIFQAGLQGVQQAVPGLVQGYLGQQVGFYNPPGQSMAQQTGQGQSQRQPVQTSSSPPVTGIGGGQFQVPSSLFPGIT